MYRELEFKEILWDGRIEYEEITKDQEIDIPVIDKNIDVLKEKKSLLVVEDNVDCDLKIMKYNLSSVLSMDRVQYSHCVNYSDFTKLNLKKIDVAVVDLKLSEDGDEFEGLKVVHDLNCRYPHCQVIIFSNHLEDPIKLGKTCGLNIRCYKKLEKGCDWRMLPKVVLDGFDLASQEEFRLEKEKMVQELKNIEHERNFLIEKLAQRKNSEMVFGSYLHELKTPLVGNFGFQELLLLDMKSWWEFEERQLSLLEAGKINQNEYSSVLKNFFESKKEEFMAYSKKMDETRKQIQKRVSIGLDYYRQKSKSVVLLGEAINQTVNFLNCCYKNSIEVEVDIKDECFLFMDYNDLRKILENLINNSIQSILDNSKCKTGKISISVAKNGNGDTKMLVKDTGEGFDETKMDRILRGGFTTKQNGSGYGLKMVAELVYHYQGQLSISNAIEGGAKVEIIFPSQNVNDNNERK